LWDPATDLGATQLAAAATAGEAEGASRDTRARADLSIPCVLLLGTAVTYRFSRPMRKWWRRQHVAHPSWPRPHAFAREGLTVGRR
jgi:hypothetical protein